MAMRIGLPIVFSFLIYASATYAANYVVSDSIPPDLLTPPPAEGGELWQEEIAAIVAIQQEPPPEEVEAARAEREMKPEMVASALSPAPARRACPRLFKLLDKVGEDGKAVNHHAKAFWNTRRPYVASPEVKALIDAHNNPAYPSGHTSGSLIWAEVLGQVFPQQREPLRRRAEEIAQHRVLVGMHYPSDIEGGRQLAWLTLGALTQSAAFRDDLSAAQAEAKTCMGR